MGGLNLSGMMTVGDSTVAYTAVPEEESCGVGVSVLFKDSLTGTTIIGWCAVIPWPEYRILFWCHVRSIGIFGNKPGIIFCKCEGKIAV